MDMTMKNTFGLFTGWLCPVNLPIGCIENVADIVRLLRAGRSRPVPSLTAFEQSRSLMHATCCWAYWTVYRCMNEGATSSQCGLGRQRGFKSIGGECAFDV